MEHKVSLPRSKEPATAEPVHTFPSYFCKIHSNVILLSMLRSSKW